MTILIKAEARTMVAFNVQEQLNSKDIYDCNIPVKSQSPRIYERPNVHKNGVPHRSILSMVGSVQHKLAKLLAELLQSVSDVF